MLKNQDRSIQSLKFDRHVRSKYFIWKFTFDRFFSRKGKTRYFPIILGTNIHSNLNLGNMFFGRANSTFESFLGVLEALSSKLDFELTCVL